MASRGLTIISGMARGVDTHAHKGAIEAKGKTIAIWGTGVDVVYPRENKKLSEQIIATGGAVVSEFAIGKFRCAAEFSYPQPDHQRNVHWRAGRRSGRIQRNPNHCAMRAGSNHETYMPSLGT